MREVGRVWNIELLGAGSTTLKTKPRGAEADSSFSIGERAALVRHAENADRVYEAPPDIVVEIDISRERIDKMPLYAAFSFVEFWRYDGQRLRAYDLRQEDFPEIERSLGLFGLPIGELDSFLEMRTEVSHSRLLDLWRQWLLEHQPR